MAEGLEVPHSDINYSDPILTSLEPTAERVFVNNSSSDATVNILKANGFKAKAVPTSSGAGFTEAIVIQKEAPSGKTVRVYRGVNQSDVSVLKQIPYAMRADSEDSYGSVTLDNVRQEVETLAEDPSYEHLLAYADKIRPQIIESQKKKLDESLTEIEDGVLRGRSVRRLLAFDQIKHGGGNLDSGVSPYVSASFNLREALKYTHEDGVLLVMDVPISQIEDLNSDESETNIKGIIDARYITAIIPRDGSILRDDQAGMQAIDAMLQTVSETAQIPAYDPEETKLVRENQLASNQEKDRKQWLVDVEEVRQKRTANLISQFSEVGLNAQEVQQKASDAKSDIYTETKTDIFDYYTNLLGKIGRGGKNASDYEYESGKSFDRDNISDRMLFQLRTLVQRQEQREAER